MRVALFVTCFNDTLFPATGRAAVELLERLGCEVAFPEGQTCCGQMHGNTGYEEQGLGLAQRWERVFDGFETVVSPSASCVGYVREHVPSAQGRLFELTEFLVDRLGVTDVGASFPHRVTLHPTCHSLRMLRVGDRPRRLLEAVRGIDLVDIEDADECCGFGGNVRGQERRDVDGDALRQAAPGAGHPRRGLHGGRQLVPDAHRGRVAAPARRRADHAPGRDPGGARVKGFPAAAHETLQNAQLRRNLGKATTTIRAKRLRAVGELPDWEALRDAGAAIKARAMATLPEQLERLEASVTRAGGVVHWARDGAEANAIVASVARSHGAREVVKVKSIATDEIGLNDALAEQGISAIETDLAELILQLSHDKTSHILVPAIHRNRMEIKALFERTITDQTLSSDATAIAEAARLHLREKFLSVPVAVSGANFGVAETGTVVVVESEGNGRMCTTLPKVLITVMGIEKVLPEWRDLEVFLQLLPRCSTAERMNPYTSLWTGVRAGDGPEEFHLVLLDGGRSDVLADSFGRQALHCIRCSACLNVCPVYSRVGGQAYESVYPGPIGAVLSPQLFGLDVHPTLPWASSLCGACYDACPVKIEIPSLLVHLRGRVVREQKSRLSPEALAMKAVAGAFRSQTRYERAQKLARFGRGPIAKAALPGWTAMRDLPEPPRETFREWWRTRAASSPPAPPSGTDS